jgi:pyruvate/2-oxoglutarate dehydrogenase complex dihydrolipoamide dehydrogenase (E3) component
MSTDPTHSQSGAEQVDAIIIGSGQAGNPLAVALSKAGRKTVIIENRYVGGTCVNTGCTPTKTLIAAAKAVEQARRGTEFGFTTGELTMDMAAVRARKREMVDIWRSGSERSLEEAENIQLVRGLGRFTSATTVEVRLNDGGTCTFTAPQIFINTGLSSITPDVEGIETTRYLTNESVMELDELPGHLLILGGSYIAVEFAQMFRRFGSRVTIVSKAEHLLPREDADVADALKQILIEDGIVFVLGATAKVAHVDDGTVVLNVKLDDGTEVGRERELTGTHLLLAVGRKPNTFALGLAAAGIEVDEHGYIPVNEKLETRVPGIYALGDVKGGPAFTHISYDDYRIVAANLLEGGHRVVSDRPVPYTVFTDPELGRIGMTETEARQDGLKIKIAKMPASSIARAYETGAKRGLLKVIVDAETDQILGAAVLTGEGGEIASMLQIAMAGKLPYTALRDMVFSHPTWAESLNTVFSHWQPER